MISLARSINGLKEDSTSWTRDEVMPFTFLCFGYILKCLNSPRDIMRDITGSCSFCRFQNDDLGLFKQLVYSSTIAPQGTRFPTKAIASLPLIKPQKGDLWARLFDSQSIRCRHHKFITQVNGAGREAISSKSMFASMDVLLHLDHCDCLKWSLLFVARGTNGYCLFDYTIHGIQS